VFAQVESRRDAEEDARGSARLIVSFRKLTTKPIQMGSAVILVTTIFVLSTVAGAWALGRALMSAPEGYEDEGGFHLKNTKSPPSEMLRPKPGAVSPAGPSRNAAKASVTTTGAAPVH
jgi:hypothetical protein